MRAPQSHEIERGITEIGHFFVPLFFVAVGAAVDLNALNPIDPSSRQSLLVGLVLILVGVAGKLAAGYRAVLVPRQQDGGRASGWCRAARSG